MKLCSQCSTPTSEVRHPDGFSHDLNLVRILGKDVRLVGRTVIGSSRNDHDKNRRAEHLVPVLVVRAIV